MEKNLDQGRHVTWLENFYDLIVVVVVAQVSVNLSHDVSFLDLSVSLHFIFLYGGHGLESPFMLQDLKLMI